MSFQQIEAVKESMWQNIFAIVVGTKTLGYVDKDKGENAPFLLLTMNMKN